MPVQKKISSFFTRTSASQKISGRMKRTADISVKEACSSDVSGKRPLLESNFNRTYASDLIKLPHMQSIGLNTMGESWFTALQLEFHKEYFTKKPVPPPPSLENMFKELSSDITGFQRPNHGDLSRWAEQGVLLLNSVLSVRAHNANSHKAKGWETFTDAVIKYINSHSAGVVFMLWGSYAQKKGSVINKNRHHVLQCVHPSPLSAYRGFFGCKHFSKANEYLRKQGDKEIDWCLQ